MYAKSIATGEGRHEDFASVAELLQDKSAYVFPFSAALWLRYHQ